MRKYTKSILAALLLATFGVFTVGIPVVHYLCPMMNEDTMACPHSSQSKDLGVTFTYETPSCCASFIIAERNTTPYTSVEKFVPHQPHIDCYALAGLTIADNTSATIVTPEEFNTSPPLSTEPLYILNSSFLI